MADKDLRRARDRFGAMPTQLAIREALLDAGATEFDVERISIHLGERLHEFKHIGGFKETRQAFITWAVRQGQLTGLFREILSELHIADSVSGLVLSRLPEYEGPLDSDILKVWVLNTASREARGLDDLGRWIAEYRNAVVVGIWSVLCDCSDLDSYLQDIADTLASDVWWGVANNSSEVLDHPAPRKLLHMKGYWAARAWKRQRLYDIQEKGEVWLKPSEFTVGLNGLQRVSIGEEGELHLDVAPEDVIDIEADQNPIIVREASWTDDDLTRESRRSGPFRADGLDVPITVI